MSYMPTRRLVLAGMAGAAATLVGGRTWAAPLDKVRASGVLHVAVYQKNEPWSWTQDGQVVGIDADLGRALAQAIGVKVEVREFLAGDDVAADLRNMVWKGSVVQALPADVLMHVPVDKTLAYQNDRAVIVGAYYREGFAMACNRETTDCDVPPPELRGKRLAVELESVPDMYLSGSFGGALRPDVHHFSTGAEAVRAVADGQADATVATLAQIDHGTKPGGRIVRRRGAVPLLLNPGWNIGIAVKDDSRDLGDELEKQLGAMAGDGRLRKIFERYGVEWHPPREV